MDEQSRITKSRPYQLRKRAEQVEATRLRIVEAAVRLHGSTGPRATTMSDVATEAGVTRATLYRHFGDEESLFAACSAHWTRQQRLPDPSAWTAHGDPARRIRTALADVYRFYAEGAEMLRRVTADHEVLPAWLRRENEEQSAQLRDALLGCVDVPRRRRALVTAVAGHVLDFATWDSLVTRHGVGPRQAVELMATLLEAALGTVTPTDRT